MNYNFSSDTIIENGIIDVSKMSANKSGIILPISYIGDKTDYEIEYKNIYIDPTSSTRFKLFIMDTRAAYSPRVDLLANANSIRCWVGVPTTAGAWNIQTTASYDVGTHVNISIHMTTSKIEIISDTFTYSHDFDSPIYYSNNDKLYLVNVNTAGNATIPVDEIVIKNHGKAVWVATDLDVSNSRNSGIGVVYTEKKPNCGYFDSSKVSYEANKNGKVIIDNVLSKVF